MGRTEPAHYAESWSPPARHRHSVIGATTGSPRDTRPGGLHALQRTAFGSSAKVLDRMSGLSAIGNRLYVT